MPAETWAIEDSQTGLWCKNYSINLNFCVWGSASQAQLFTTKTQADNAITQWGETPGERFIGKNPPPH